MNPRTMLAALFGLGGLPLTMTTRVRPAPQTYPHSSPRQRERYARQGLHMGPGLATGQEIIQRARGR